MKEIHGEIENATGDGLAIEHDVLFVEMPATRTGDQDSGFVVQLVGLAFCFKRDGAIDGVTHIDLAVNHVVPSGTVRVLKIGHEGRGTAIECVDHHLAIGGACNLDSSIL